VSSPAPIGIVIPNHNYGRFVGAAIDSALAQDLEPKPPVVVVDDGSTDDSRSVIGARADRIHIIFQECRGQRAACVAGWRRLRTPIVIFLDSDDLLDPAACSAVLRYWRSNTVKLQWRMAIIDGNGRPTGVVFPKYSEPIDTEVARRELLRAGSYPSPPTSGNAYAGELVERAAERNDLPFIDTVLNTAAPLLGEVAAIDSVLSYYRVHDRNRWAGSTLDIDQIARRLALEETKVEWLARFAGELGVELDPSRLLAASVFYQEQQLAICRLTGASARKRLAATSAFVRAVLASPEGVSRKALWLTWALTVGLGPDALARAALVQRLLPTMRAPVFETLFGRARASSRAGPGVRSR
jgi:glycosyltransferase involved in cell wall biosynthesis